MAAPVAPCSTAAYDAGPYYNIVLDVTDYGRTGYSDLDLVRMNVVIENLADFGMVEPNFVLGGATEYIDDPPVNPDTAITSWYGDSTYAEVRAHGDLALFIDARAIYSAEGFVDVTGGSPVLVPDVVMVW